MDADEQPEHDEQDAMIAEVLPLVEQAVTARIAGNFIGCAMALNQMFKLDELRISLAMSALTTSALQGVPARKVPGESWIPRFVAGNPPKPVDPAEPAARFVLGYLAAFLRRDPEAAGTLWRDFAYRPEDAPEPELMAARADVSMAFVLMLQLAARGATATVPHHRGNAHPGARRTTHRPHQRRR